MAQFDSIPRPALQPDALSRMEDLRFRALLSRAAWNALPDDIQRRFSKRAADERATVYIGVITDMRRNRAGRWLALALKLVGAPLPLADDCGVPSVVTVTEDFASGGQIWSRLYSNRRGFPQVIHSSKRFSGPTGLEEHLGYGLSMALSIRAEPDALVFESAGYRLRIGRLSLPLPRWMSPGAVTVIHRDKGAGAFEFSLQLVSPVFGEMIYQSGLFREDAR